MKSSSVPSDQETDQKKYELMVIINPDIGENATKKRLDEIRKLISAQKGEMFFEDMWGVRDFAYTIKKHDKGYYAIFDFMLLPEMLKEIDATLRLEPEVLRHMIIALPFKYEAKSFAVQKEEVVEAPKVEEKSKIKPRTRPAEKTEKVVEKPAKTEVKEKAKKEELKETSLEEVDAKLKSIIDNPDINF